MNKKDFLIFDRINSDSSECEKILFCGINAEAKKARGLKPIRSFCFSLENNQKEIFGGINGFAYYGCLYVDMLYIKDPFRKKGFGVQLMQKAEDFGKNHDCFFSTVNTMDFEALPFYQKLGYAIEFIRDGYDQHSKMYMLRKNL